MRSKRAIERLARVAGDRQEERCGKSIRLQLTGEGDMEEQLERWMEAQKGIDGAKEERVELARAIQCPRCGEEKH